MVHNVMVFKVPSPNSNCSQDPNAWAVEHWRARRNRSLAPTTSWCTHSHRAVFWQHVPIWWRLGSEKLRTGNWGLRQSIMKHKRHLPLYPIFSINCMKNTFRSNVASGKRVCSSWGGIVHVAHGYIWFCSIFIRSIVMSFYPRTGVSPLICGI